MVFFANPNNPTGTYVPFDEVRRLQASLPPHVVLVSMRPMRNMSGATTTRPASNGRDLRKCGDDPHLFEDLRAGGVAARVDVGPDHVVDAVNRIRGPFNVSSPAIEAGIAAIASARRKKLARITSTGWPGSPTRSASSA